MQCARIVKQIQEQSTVVVEITCPRRPKLSRQFPTSTSETVISLDEWASFGPVAMTHLACQVATFNVGGLSSRLCFVHKRDTFRTARERLSRKVIPSKALTICSRFTGVIAFRATQWQACALQGGEQHDLPLGGPRYPGPRPSQGCGRYCLNN